MRRTPWKKRWDNFRELPGVMQAGAWLALAILAMVLWPRDARADLVSRNASTNSEIRLLDVPSDNADVLALIPPQFQARFRSARIRVQGEEIGACWMREGDTAGLLLLDDGSAGRMDLSAFSDPSL